MLSEFRHKQSMLMLKQQQKTGVNGDGRKVTGCHKPATTAEYRRIIIITAPFHTRMKQLQTPASIMPITIIFRQHCISCMQKIRSFTTELTSVSCLLLVSDNMPQSNFIRTSPVSRRTYDRPQVTCQCDNIARY